MKKPTFNKDELQLILSLYAQGHGLKSIGKQVHRSIYTIKNILIAMGVYKSTKSNLILYHKKCDICGNFFWCFSPKRKYCYDPCRDSYKEGSAAQTKALNFHYINVIRCEFWRMIESNPQEALEYEKTMIKEEGQEFTDKVLGNITKSDKFKQLMEIYKNYQSVFENEVK